MRRWTGALKCRDRQAVASARISRIGPKSNSLHLPVAYIAISDVTLLLNAIARDHFRQGILPLGTLTRMKPSRRYGHGDGPHANHWVHLRLLLWGPARTSRIAGVLVRPREGDR